MPLRDQEIAISYCVDEEVLLFEKFKRVGHFVESNWPILPDLALLFYLAFLSFLQIVPPRTADQDTIAPQSVDELWIFYKALFFFRTDLVFVPVAAGLVDWKSPPIIMAVMKHPVTAVGIPRKEMFVLL
jgi:hypothetical protein